MTGFSLPMMASSSSGGAVFSILLAGLQTTSGNLQTLVSGGGGTLSATAFLLGINQSASRFYLAETISSNGEVHTFSYTSLDDLTTGVAYVGSVNIQAIDANLQTLQYGCVSEDGTDVWLIRSNAFIYHCTLGTGWDFNTLTLTDSITDVDLATNSGFSSLTSITGLAENAGILYLRARVNGSSYYLCQATLGAGGSVSALAIAASGGVPSPSAESAVTGTRVNNVGANRIGGKLYGNWSLAAANSLAEYSPYSVNATTVDMNALGIANNLGITVSDDGIYLATYDTTDKFVYCFKNQ